MWWGLRGGADFSLRTCFNRSFRKNGGAEAPRRLKSAAQHRAVQAGYDSGLMLRALLLCLFLAAPWLHARPPVYVVLWFDTEDYIEPASDDAALRIANDLTAEGVQGTFKVVGEKARVLESRGRRDVIEALSKHAVGYHSNWHSLHPTPSEYLAPLGFLEGVEEFERRESAGVADVERVFGTQPVCYGQPGTSWGPQSNPALRKLGIRVYLDEGEQVGLNNEPFWYGGLLHVFQMGRNKLRAELNAGPEDKAAYAAFDKAADRLAAQGGGIISIYYHPTEFVTTEFWDAVNFKYGANPEREVWVKPHRRTAEDSERCYGVLRHFVEHMKTQADVRFVTAKDLPGIYRSGVPRAVDRKAAARQLQEKIVFAEVRGQMLSPADMVLALLGLDPQVVDGPTAGGATTYAKTSIPAPALERARLDAADFVLHTHRLPNAVMIGAKTLSLADFAATLAGSIIGPSGEVPVIRGRIEFERYFATNPQKPFDWIIHPKGFSGSHLLELGRLQGWTLKPARLAQRE